MHGELVRGDRLSIVAGCTAASRSQTARDDTHPWKHLREVVLGRGFGF